MILKKLVWVYSVLLLMLSMNGCKAETKENTRKIDFNKCDCICIFDSKNYSIGSVISGRDMIIPQLRCEKPNGKITVPHWVRYKKR